MSYNIKELMSLPAEEKIAIADLLYSSVDEELNDKEHIKPWYEDEGFLSELDKRVKEWEEGRSKGYTIDEVKNFMEDYKTRYRRK